VPTRLTHQLNLTVGSAGSGLHQRRQAGSTVNPSGGHSFPGCLVAVHKIQLPTIPPQPPGETGQERGAKQRAQVARANGAANVHVSVALTDGTTADAARVYSDLMTAASQLPGLTPCLPFGAAFDGPIQAQADADPQQYAPRHKRGCPVEYSRTRSMCAKVSNFQTRATRRHAAARPFETRPRAGRSRPRGCSGNLWPTGPHPV
jgi:hypothetical protein